MITALRIEGLQGSMDAITFSVPGKPVGKGRPKATTISGQARMYTPKKTVNYENLVKVSYMREHSERKPFPPGLPLRLSVWCWFAIPKSWTKKKKVAALHHVGKPDADNILKAIGDALNGIAWHDDSQVATACVFKRYCLDGEREETMVEVTPMHNASVSISGDEPEYAPRSCSASSCCGSGVKIAGSDEGTHWYECLSCGKPCDLVPHHLRQNTNITGGE